MIKKGHLFVGFLRILSIIKGKVNYTLIKQGESGHCAYQKIAVRFIKTFPVEYDMAFGFLDPHFIIQEKVNAKMKIGWVHTDWNKLYKEGKYVPAPDMWRKLDYIACVSDDVRESFNTLYPQYSSRTIVVENVLSSEYVRRQSRVKDVSSEIDGAVFSILSVGRFSDAKNFLDAIRACKLLEEQNIAFKWYFIGFGPKEQDMENLISELNLNDRAIILGKKINPYPYMLACDLYAQPSVFEGKAVTVREAQMLGKPVLITNYPTANSQIKNGYDGHICKLDIESIASDIVLLKNHPDYCEMISNNCLNEDYSNSCSTQKLLDFLSLEKEQTRKRVI